MVHIHTCQQNTHTYKINFKRKKSKEAKKVGCVCVRAAVPRRLETPERTSVPLRAEVRLPLPGEVKASSPVVGRGQRLTHQLQQLIQGFTEDSKSLLTGKGLLNREQLRGSAHLPLHPPPYSDLAPLEKGSSPLCRLAGKLEPAGNGAAHWGP